jgi:hypothetical protein
VETTSRPVKPWIDGTMSVNDTKYFHILIDDLEALGFTAVIYDILSGQSLLETSHPGHALRSLAFQVLLSNKKFIITHVKGATLQYNMMGIRTRVLSAPALMSKTAASA